MSTLVEPGTRLAGRYRLQEQASEFNGSTLWKAVDEPLARLVAVRTFADGFPHVSHVIAAARAASRVADSRLAQVFDADESVQHPYLVCEWIDGSRLSDLLTEGPLEPERAVGFLREASDALAAAHAAGLAHGWLGPSALIWAKGGTVKITGLAIDAALHGQAVDAGGSATDTATLGALLYAALTGYWPEGPPEGNPDARTVGLHPAPRSDDGVPLRVSEMRPDLPPALDAITERALGRSHDGQPPLDTPDALGDALSSLPRMSLRTLRPARASAAARGTVGGPAGPPGSGAVADVADDGTGRSAAAAPSGAAAPLTERPAARPGPGLVRVLLFGAVGILVLAATAFVAWEIGRTIEDSRGGQPAATPGATGNANTGPGPALDVAVEDHDPQGDGRANPDDAPKTVDGDPTTFWTTQTYTTAQLGNLKPGVGLMLDMGEAKSFRSVRVLLADGGTSLQLYTGDRPERGRMTEVASATNASGQTVLRPEKPAEGRYILLWFTELPPVSDGYRAGVAEIVVHGT